MLNDDFYELILGTLSLNDLSFSDFKNEKNTFREFVIALWFSLLSF